MKKTMKYIVIFLALLLKGYVICDEDKSTVAVTQIFTTETAETAIVSEINLNISIPFVETATSSSPNAIHSTSRPIASTTDKETEIHLSTFSNTTVSTVSLDTPISTSLPDEKITDHESENFCSTKNTENLNSSITMLNGDVIVTFILSNNENLTSSILFMVNHINSIDLLSYNISLGVRILSIDKTELLREILINEIDYLERCVEFPFGIFLSNDLYRTNLSKLKSVEFKIWSLASVEELKFRKVAHLLEKLPWNNLNTSVEVRSDRRENFLNVLRSEKMCINSFPSSDNLFIVVGNSELMSSINFALNGTLIIVPLSLTNWIMSDLPDKSYMLLENEIRLSSVKNQLELSILPSEYIAIGSTLLEVSKTINIAVWKNCNRTDTKLELSECEPSVYDDLSLIENIQTYDVKNLLKLMQMEHLKNSLNYDLYQKNASNSNETAFSSVFKKLETINYVTNDTTVHSSEDQLYTLGSLFNCTIENHSKHENTFHLDDALDIKNSIEEEYLKMHWQIKSELWIAIGLTVSSLGVLLCLAILLFIIVRICMDDVLEGNPIGSILLLVALILQFASFLPFTVEYSGYHEDPHNAVEAIEIYNSHCTVKIFLISVCYCLTFSLLLSRSIMLASIGSEGGFLSHVNGYIQSIICVFSFLVQVGLSTQLLILMNTNTRHLTCEVVFYGNWFWGIIAYDGALLVMMVFLSPFIFKSQRNYQEGILLVICGVLCLFCWIIWIPLSMLGDGWREILVPLGVQATAWVILSSLMVPRCFLIVKSIARSDFAQALPSLTSLAFAQANQYISEPSVYECVNPSMLQRSSEELDTDQTQLPNEYSSPNDVPTLPLRSNRRSLMDNYNLNFNEMINPELSPNKITRF